MSPTGSPSGKLRVLVVDDEPVLLRSVERMLARSCEVTLLDSPRAALSLLSSGARFDVVLCDLMMAELTGVELYQKVHELDLGQARRFLFMSGGVATVELEHFLAASEQRHCAKPFSIEELIGQVHATAHSPSHS